MIDRRAAQVAEAEFPVFQEMGLDRCDDGSADRVAFVQGEEGPHGEGFLGEVEAGGGAEEVEAGFVIVPVAAAVEIHFGGDTLGLRGRTRVVAAEV